MLPARLARVAFSANGTRVLEGEEIPLDISHPIDLHLSIAFDPPSQPSIMALTQVVYPNQGPTKLPGFGLPLDHMPEWRDRFLHAIFKLPKNQSYHVPRATDAQIEVDRKAKVNSYINNLHPEDHEDLYGILERLVECAIPLWNEPLW